MSLFEHILFGVLAVIAFGTFGYNLQVIWRKFERGKGQEEARHLNIVMRLADVLISGFGQRKMFKDKTAGIMHALIFWGFLTVSLGTLETLLSGIISEFNFSKILGECIAYHGFLRSQDVANALVALAILFAYYRRLVTPPKRLASLGPDSRHDAYTVLGFILALMVTALLSLGARVHAELLPRGPLPVASAFAAALNPFQADWKQFDHVVWWVHCLLLFSFTVFLPFSKHQHLIWAWPNIFFRSHKGRGRLRPMTFDENAESFGA
jgi:hypothetical protein